MLNVAQKEWIKPNLECSAENHMLVLLKINALSTFLIMIEHILVPDFF